MLTGSVSMSVGERLGRGGAGAGVTSIVNGLGSAGAILEGPLVGATSQYLGWAGVVHGVVLLSLLSALATYRAHTVALTATAAPAAQDQEGLLKEEQRETI